MIMQRSTLSQKIIVHITSILSERVIKPFSGIEPVCVLAIIKSNPKTNIEGLIADYFRNDYK